MKHIKLFESFSKYDFVRYRIDLDEVVNQLVKDMVDLATLDFQAILEYMDSSFEVIYIKNSVGFMQCRITGQSHGVYYVVNSLSDYCYSISIFDTKASEIRFIQVFEDIESLLLVLGELNDNGDLF